MEAANVAPGIFGIDVGFWQSLHVRNLGVYRSDILVKVFFDFETLLERNKVDGQLKAKTLSGLSLWSLVFL
jgi:hypothetical protein